MDQTPLAAGKPFITADATSGKFALNIPAPARNTTGPPSDVTASAGGVGSTSSSQVVDFSAVYVAANATDTASSINAKLSAGLHVVLSPGVYALEAPLKLTSNGQVLLGLGMATLIPTQVSERVSVFSPEQLCACGCECFVGA